MGVTDGLAEPMAEIFGRRLKPWKYTTIVPEVLHSTQLPLPPKTVQTGSPSAKGALAYVRPRGDAAYWQKVMADQNFAKEDKLDEPRFNRALWQGLKNSAYPTLRDGRDLSKDRKRSLQAERAAFD